MIIRGVRGRCPFEGGLGAASVTLHGLAGLIFGNASGHGAHKSIHEHILARGDLVDATSRHDAGDPQLASDDRGVRGGAAQLGHDSHAVRGVEVRRVRRRQIPRAENIGAFRGRLYLPRMHARIAGLVT